MCAQPRAGESNQHYKRKNCGLHTNFSNCTRLTLATPFVKTRIVRTGQDRHRNLAIVIGLIAIAVRLIAINQPFIDSWSWRQSDVAAIARNYSNNGFHFACPQIDWAGDQPGYVGTEFPILPFIAGICYKFSGVHEWIGRVQAVILFAASLPFFFLLVREIFGEVAAVWATFFHGLAPLDIVAGRAFMPDVPSLSLALAGLYFFVRWIDNDKARSFLAAAVLISLSILIKLPNVLIGAPIAYLVFQRFGVAAFRRGSLWLFAVIALLPSIIWYGHAYEIAQKFYPHHFFGAGGIQMEGLAWYWKIAKQISTSSLTPLLFVLAVLGAFLARSTRRALAFHVWLGAMILFIVVAGYGNRHQWYQLPLVPIAAALAGAACAIIASKLASRNLRVGLSILLAGSSCFFAWVYARPFYEPVNAQLRNAGLELKRMTPEDSLVVAADNGDPTIFYYAERKGWHFLEKEGIYEGDPIDSEQLIVDLAKLRGHGATHLVFTKNTSWWLDYYREFAQYLAENTTLMEATPEFKIYRLSSTRESGIGQTPDVSTWMLR